eukprot:CAMPEP_0115565804 /NCGR_PEP_ID=MMETSP0271-20121206/103260_1 /TAXON_ID=71861 /ORGANISM="Scrippsiella trochoidea, Strain CCMP3099" /LENGTH=63 /DNA_ID=CAMNT_0003000097 /DNA_START=24 /DNA_END=211 /DNA_ORIENTATION=+
MGMSLAKLAVSCRKFCEMRSMRAPPSWAISTARQRSCSSLETGDDDVAHVADKMPQRNLAFRA